MSPPLKGGRGDSLHFIIKNAAVRRSMRRCLIAQSRSMSKTPRPPSCAYPSSGLIAVRPPYKNTLRSQKSVPLHSTLKKCYAARSIMYIRPMVISFLKAWRSQLTFGFEKGRQVAHRSPTQSGPPTQLVAVGRAEVSVARRFSVAVSTIAIRGPNAQPAVSL